jgi:uncharacterized protein GlcG (DUF336 family)
MTRDRRFKTLALIMAALPFAFVTGCGENQEPPKAKPAKTAPPAKPTPTPATAPVAAATNKESPGLYSIRTMTPETALKAVQAALSYCRQSDYQVAVAVVDRGGNVQVLLRDRYAGPHTPETAVEKARTAVSFRTDTLDLVEPTQAGQAQSGARHIGGVLMLGGGVQIEAAGSLVGSLGVSGAPTGQDDHNCAKAGVSAIEDILNF